MVSLQREVNGGRQTSHRNSSQLGGRENSENCKIEPFLGFGGFWIQIGSILDIFLQIQERLVDDLKLKSTRVRVEF